MPNPACLYQLLRSNIPISFPTRFAMASQMLRRFYKNLGQRMGTVLGNWRQCHRSPEKFAARLLEMAVPDRIRQLGIAYFQEPNSWIFSKLVVAFPTGVDATSTTVLPRVRISLSTM